MKIWGLSIFICFILYSCAPSQYNLVTKNPGGKDSKNNTFSTKENKKQQRAQAKAAQKKREEFANYESETRPDQFIKKKRSQRR